MTVITNVEVFAVIATGVLLMGAGFAMGRLSKRRVRHKKGNRMGGRKL